MNTGRRKSDQIFSKESCDVPSRTNRSPQLTHYSVGTNSIKKSSLSLSLKMTKLISKWEELFYRHLQIHKFSQIQWRSDEVRNSFLELTRQHALMNWFWLQTCNLYSINTFSSSHRRKIQEYVFEVKREIHLPS